MVHKVEGIRLVKEARQKGVELQEFTEPSEERCTERVVLRVAYSEQEEQKKVCTFGRREGVKLGQNANGGLSVGGGGSGAVAFHGIKNGTRSLLHVDIRSLEEFSHLLSEDGFEICAKNGSHMIGNDGVGILLHFTGGKARWVFTKECEDCTKQK